MSKEHGEEAKRERLTLEQVEEVVRERMLIAGVMKPTAILEGELGRRIIVMDNLGETADDRALRMMRVGYDLGQERAIGHLLQMTFIAEAWYTTAKSEDALLPPSQDPQRTECILIAQAQLEAQTTTVHLLRIVRDSTDEFQMLVPLDTGPERPKQLDSPLINAFLYGFWAGSDGPRSQAIH